MSSSASKEHNMTAVLGKKKKRSKKAMFAFMAASAVLSRVSRLPLSHIPFSFLTMIMGKPKTATAALAGILTGACWSVYTMVSACVPTTG